MYHVDFSEVKAQREAIAELEQAAILGHNVLFVGPPGIGKTMLARRYSSIFPKASTAESEETATLCAMGGQRLWGTGTARPFRAPHWTCSAKGLTGHRGTPGEMTLAHNGVLHLDELPEFSSLTLKMVYTAMKMGTVTQLSEDKLWLWPADFILTASMNPCACGYHGSHIRRCECSPQQIVKYWDRTREFRQLFQTAVNVRVVGNSEIVLSDPGESSAEIRARVVAARAARVGLYRRPRTGEWLIDKAGNEFQVVGLRSDLPDICRIRERGADPTAEPDSFIWRFWTDGKLNTNIQLLEAT